MAKQISGPGKEQGPRERASFLANLGNAAFFGVIGVVVFGALAYGVLTAFGLLGGPRASIAPTPTPASAATGTPVGSATPEPSNLPGDSPSPAPPSTQPPVGTSCADAPFLAWANILDRSIDGTYEVSLESCQLLWMNAGSVVVEGQRLGGEVPDQNTVLLYQATHPMSVNVAAGRPEDLGHEWLATTSADFTSTIAAWAEQALGGTNCGTGCSSLVVFEFVDGRLIGKNTVASATTGGPCSAEQRGVLTALQTELWQLGGGFLQAEFYVGDEPEREAILPVDVATLGYRILTPLKGMTWSYPTTCTFQNARDSVDVHVADRIYQGYRNNGYVDWQRTGFLEAVSVP